MLCSCAPFVRMWCIWCETNARFFSQWFLLLSTLLDRVAFTLNYLFIKKKKKEDKTHFSNWYKSLLLSGSKSSIALKKVPSDISRAEKDN